MRFKCFNIVKEIEIQKKGSIFDYYKIVVPDPLANTTVTVL